MGLKVRNKKVVYERVCKSEALTVRERQYETNKSDSVRAKRKGRRVKAGKGCEMMRKHENESERDEEE